MTAVHITSTMLAVWCLVCRSGAQVSLASQQYPDAFSFTHVQRVYFGEIVEGRATARSPHEMGPIALNFRGI